MHLQVILGKKLTNDELNFINLKRYEEFNSKEKIMPTSENKDGNNTFVLLKNEQNQIVSFGKIEVLPIIFQDTPYEVFCISTIVASPKGAGYGTQLMENVKKYIQENGGTMIGFCETSLLPFYKSCGFKIISTNDNKFVYIDSEGKVIPKIVPGEVFYLEGADKLISRILEANDKTVRIFKEP